MAAPATLFAKSTRLPPGDPLLRARDERLDALKAVVGKLAHDFNNFLVPQFGYLTLIAEELPAGSPTLQYLKTAETAGRTTETYIETVLLAVRPQRRYAPKDFDLGSLLVEILETWERELPPGIGIALERAIDPGLFHGDETHWRTVIKHLLSNARFALASGGKLSVSFQKRELGSAELTRLGLSTSAVYRLCIEDSGFGIEESHFSRIFEPFFTTRGVVRGSGLGLTIVHSVTHFHGGQVEVSSEEGRGTTFTLWIPREPVAAHRSAVGGVLRQPSTRKRKILLVEDDPVLKEILRGWLAAQEFDVQIAETAAAAAKQLERSPSPWVLVITETRLKAGTGEEVYQAARRHEGLACVFLAGNENPSVQDPPVPLLVLQKPLSRRPFLDRVLPHVRIDA